MSISHTPGPWRVEQGTPLVWGNCNPDDRSTYGMGYPVASMEKPLHWSGSGEPTIDTQEANARLIAAAPDLLAALLAVDLARHTDAEADWEKATRLSDAAISKATSRQPEGER
jgi:hypothetical protein